MPLKWRKVWISDETFEAAGVFDVNGDGVLDIVSGGFWYEGPEFRKKHPINEVPRFGEYYDDFSVIPLDVNGNGRTDFVTGGWWGDCLVWNENPGQSGAPWKQHKLATGTTNVETARGWDIDGDGQIEIVPNTPNNPEVAYYKLCTDAAGNGTAEFRKVVVHRFAEGRQGHGLGCGDLAGNGRMDVVLCKGWLEAPADPENGQWLWHEEFANAPWNNHASVPMLVEDVEGDGQNEIIVGSAHNYGLWWCKRAADGVWKYHPIDPYNAQYHDLQWADIDVDGRCELITGKRHRAHCGNDPGEWDDRGIYYFKWTGEGFAKQIIDYGPLGVGQGCGIQFALADLHGSGRLDVIAPGKDGLFVFYNEGL